MDMEERPKRTWRGEGLYCIALFTLASLSGWLYLGYQAGPPIHDYNNRNGAQFLPAIKWATGHGFSYPFPHRFPGKNGGLPAGASGPIPGIYRHCAASRERDEIGIPPGGVTTKWTNRGCSLTLLPY